MNRSEGLSFYDQLVSVLPTLRPLARRRAPSPDMVDDLLQTVAVKALTARQTEPIVNMAAWLTTILCRSALDQRRGRKFDRLCVVAPDGEWKQGLPVAALSVGDPCAHRVPEARLALCEALAAGANVGN